MADQHLERMIWKPHQKLHGISCNTSERNKNWHRGHIKRFKEASLMKKGIFCKVLLTGMEALSYCSWLDEIAFTDIAGDMRIEIFHQVLPLSSHSWRRKSWQSARDQRSKSERWRCPHFTRAVALLCATGLLQAFAFNSGRLTGAWLITPAPVPDESSSYL